MRLFLYFRLRLDKECKAILVPQFATAPIPPKAVVFPPASNTGTAIANRGPIPPCCLPTPGLRFLAVPYRLLPMIELWTVYLYLHQTYAL